MKYKILLLILSFLFTTGCSTQNIKESSFWKESNKLFNQSVNQKVKEQLNSLSDGELEIKYFPNGNKKSECNLTNGIKTKCNEWHENGSFIGSKLFYKNGKSKEKGGPTEDWIKYTTPRMLKVIRKAISDDFKSNEKEFIHPIGWKPDDKKTWYENGQLKSLTKYDASMSYWMPIEETHWYENGNKKYEKIDGLEIEYFRNGNKKYEKNNKWNERLEIEYFSNGKKKSECRENEFEECFEWGENGLVIRNIVSFYDNGILIRSVPYIGEKINGTVETYYKTGELFEESRFKDGKLEAFVMYKKNGDVYRGPYGQITESE